MRNNPCPICKNPIKDLLILEVDEKTKDINIVVDLEKDKKDEIIDIKEEHYDNNNNINNIIEDKKENINEENKIDDENNEENKIDN